MAKVGAASKVLREKPSVITRAVLWKIPHDTPRDDIRLKLGRYKKSDEDPFADDVPETLEPKSELSLDDEEFKALIEFIREQYEPFRQGVNASMRSFLWIDPMRPRTQRRSARCLRCPIPKN